MNDLYFKMINIHLTVLTSYLKTPDPRKGMYSIHDAVNSAEMIMNKLKEIRAAEIAGMKVGDRVFYIVENPLTLEKVVNIGEIEIKRRLRPEVSTSPGEEYVFKVSGHKDWIPSSKIMIDPAFTV